LDKIKDWATVWTGQYFRFLLCFRFLFRYIFLFQNLDILCVLINCCYKIWTFYEYWYIFVTKFGHLMFTNSDIYWYRLNQSTYQSNYKHNSFWLFTAVFLVQSILYHMCTNNWCLDFIYLYSTFFNIHFFINIFRWS